METIIAYGITFLFGVWLVNAETREENRRKRIEEEKVQRLKFFLKKCAESRELEENRRRL